MAIGLIVAASVAALSLDHTWEGVTQSRQYSQVVPACAPTGLIIALHGAGGDSSWECQGLSEVVNNIGVVLVCPQGRGGAWKAFSSCDECDNSGGWSDGDDSEDVSFIRSEVNSELNFSPNFEGLVLGCIDADFCK